MSVTPEFCSAWPLIADTASGTSDSCSSRRVAVTMISPLSSAFVSAPVCGACAVWFWAMAGTAMLHRAAEIINEVLRI